MAKSALVCPSCFASLKLPGTIPDGAFLKCPKCAARFRQSAAQTATAPAASEFWENVRLDAPAAPHPPAAPAVPESPAAPAVSAVSAVPAAQLASRRGPLVAVTAAVGLSIGLGVALSVALSGQGRPEPNPAAPNSDAALAAAPPPAVNDPAPPKPPEPPPPPPAPPPGPPAWAFDHWLQDSDQAQRQAADQGKDVLLLFDSSDWSAPSKALAEEVFPRPDLWGRLTARFVPVHIDFPQYPTAQRRVADARRNAALFARYFRNRAYPWTVLADPGGRPYAVESGYQRGKPEQYVAALEKAARGRADRDELLGAVDRADGAAKLPAARKALDYLIAEVEGPSGRGDGTYILDLREFYGPLLKEWRDLADVHDPENNGGQREWFFWQSWTRRVDQAVAGPNPDGAVLRALADEFADWSARCQLQKSNCGVDLLARQADLLGRLGDKAGREKALRAALGISPSRAWTEEINGRLGEKRPSAEKEPRHLAVGQPMPDVTGEGLDGKARKVSDYKGKVVVVDVWATWCGPCRAMIPHEREMVKRLEGKPFALISVSCDEEKQTLTKFLQGTPMPWAHWWVGTDSGLAEVLNIRSYPTIYVLDAKGVIRHKNIRGEALEAAVVALLRETPKGRR